MKERYNSQTVWDAAMIWADMAKNNPEKKTILERLHQEKATLKKEFDTFTEFTPHTTRLNNYLRTKSINYLLNHFTL